MVENKKVDTITKEALMGLDDANQISQQTENKFAQFARFAQFASQEKKQRDDDLANTLSIPREVYQNLPELLQKGVSVFELQREKDVFLTGAIGILSGCFPTVKGLYASEEHYANLNCFIVAPPASGKGAMKHSKTLGDAIHDDKLNQYKEKLAENDNNNQDTQDLPQQLLFIPANISSPAVIRHLVENNETGIICETEADTMSEAFKLDWGGYSDLIRKAFHHETVSSSRKTNREYYELKKPKLSVVLSGTPDQVKNLIQSSENGLFSRMLFYAFDGVETWKSVAPKQDGLNLNKFFTELSEEVKAVSDKFSGADFEFKLTSSQWETLDSQFSNWLMEITSFIHKNTSSVVKRLGLVQYRIAMVLSILRHHQNKIEDNTITCTDQDFKIAQLLSNVYLDHALTMFFKLPAERKLYINKSLKNFYDALPIEEVFPREKAISIGRSIRIADRTIDKYLARLVKIEYLNQPEYGKYQKS